MASVSSLGTGSGIDLQSLVDGLVAAESEVRLGGLATREVEATERISAYGLLKSSASLFNDSLSTLANIATFRARTAESSNEEAFTISASDDAGLGSYGIEVISEGSAQTLVTGALVDVTNTAIASADTAIGGGTLTIQQGGQPAFEVAIDSVSSSLNDIANAINTSEGNTGVQASVLTADAGPVLVLNTSEVGSDNEITITVSDIDGNDTDTLGLSQLTFDSLDIPGSNLSQQTAAVDAQILVNGLTVTSTSSNIFSDVVSGVTITALAPTTSAGTATISKNTQAAVDAVNEFIESFNALVGSIGDLGRAGTEEGGGGGVLVGDSVLRSLSSQLRRTIFTSIDDSQPAGVQTLSDIGVRLSREGTLSLDSAKFDELLESDFDDVARLLAADGNPIDQNNTFRSTNFATTSSVVGEGQLTLTVGENSFTVDILAGSNTLTDVRDAINNAVDNIGVSASIVLVDNGGGTEAQLILSSSSAGEALSITASDNDGNDTDLAGLSQLVSGNLIEITSSELDAPEGIIVLLQSVVSGFLGGSGEQGIIDARTEGLNADIERIEDERLRQEQRLEKFEARLVAQFSALDLLVANLTSSGDFLLSQLNAASSISLNSNRNNSN